MTKKTPFDLVKGQEVVFQLLKGTIVRGTFGGLYDMFFVVTNAEIVGTKHVCETPMVFIHKNQVQHFHLKPEKLVRKEG